MQIRFANRFNLAPTVGESGAKFRSAQRVIARHNSSKDWKITCSGLNDANDWNRRLHVETQRKRDENRTKIQREQIARAFRLEKRTRSNRAETRSHHDGSFRMRAVSSEQFEIRLQRRNQFFFASCCAHASYCPFISCSRNSGFSSSARRKLCSPRARAIVGKSRREIADETPFRQR